MTLPDDVVERALDAWENTAGTRRDMMRNALEAARYGELVEALNKVVSAQDETNDEAERAKQPGANAWSSAPMVRLIHAHKEARALLSTIGEPDND